MSRPCTLAAPVPASLFPGRPWRQCLAFVVAIVIAAALAPIAQAVRPARIEGRVTGEGRVGVPGARVTLLPVDDLPPLAETTDSAGAFAFTQVRPGRYRIDVSYDAVHASSEEPVLFEAGETYTLDLNMTP